MSNRSSTHLFSALIHFLGIILCVLYLCVCSPLFTSAEEAKSEDYSTLQNGPLREELLIDATAHYEGLIAEQRGGFNSYFRLMEALYLRGYFIENTSRKKKKLFSRLVALSKKTLTMLEENAKVSENFSKLSLEHRAEQLRKLPQAAQVHFWAAVNWGLWGMEYGYLASATEGVADKIREHSQMLVLLDSGFADSGGYRILGRMHTVTPRIPFFTGWIERKKGISFLRTAYAISREDPRNSFFLAEALLKYRSSAKKEALSLLEETALRKPRETHWAEDNETITAAKKRLVTERP